MLDQWVQRVKRLFFTSKPPTMEQERHARERRHDLVLRLQKDVRQLQQEISDLSDLEGVNADPQAAAEESERMRSLQRQLREKQTELARYQARI